ncbi:hypothetical protein S7711_02359 [Stachybotrys chartarum IBT 7711]|uniref:Zn(2)-C6 fungal-type domain-containing protein n=1 Tax=Stachybotrys chartarum (strain CBS 109288 / IBT 7711) TaxID=1280523 RepID=A0A084B123_STACB|nr:hypothetical protein S7711_02359 [Stachybotrys chartarum IBT 7711]KFA56425.1 hypothetical protein S40293_05059 [Stachybotrys chartarum IBT 40293]
MAAAQTGCTPSPSRLSPPRPSRQQPGRACEECRRKKLRCDRQQPQCGYCEDNGVECDFVAPPRPRGPKRGHMKLLHSKIATLEKRIIQLNGGGPCPDEGPFDLQDWPAPTIGPLDNLDPCLFSAMSDNAMVGPVLPVPTMGLSPPESVTKDGLAMGAPPPSSLSMSYSPELQISTLMRADLDQLFFDRAYASVPILHPRRYANWASKLPSNILLSQQCLQYAIWTLASALTAQFEHIREPLYKETRKMLEILEANNDNAGSECIEHAQAWILVTIYELMRVQYRRGWMSAGRAFRLVQLMRLNEIDYSTGMEEEKDLIEMEEKRRTFWVAYLLDRFINMHNGWPLTLSDEGVCTRLPCLEDDFQSGQETVTDFLSEAIASGSQVGSFSPLAETVILATICGRIMSHQQRSTVERTYGGAPQQFWERHQRLETILSQRIQALSLKAPPSDLAFVDPVLLFTDMMAQAAVLFLDKIMQTSTFERDGNGTPIEKYESHLVSAAHKIVIQAKMVQSLSFFKVCRKGSVLAMSFCYRHPEWYVIKSFLQLTR